MMGNTGKLYMEMNTQAKQKKLSLLRSLLYIWYSRSAKAMLSKLHCVKKPFSVLAVYSFLMVNMGEKMNDL